MHLRIGRTAVGLAAFAMLLLLSSACFAQSNRPYQLDNIRFAESFATTHSDCSDNIKAAFDDLGSGHGQVWVSNACGMSLSHQVVNIPNGDALVFDQPGAYTTMTGITMGTNSALYSSIPQAPNAGPVTIKAADNAHLAAVVTVNGGQSVIHDLTLDGNASASCAKSNNHGTIVGSYPLSVNGVLSITAGAGRLEMERLEVQCGADAGIVNDGAQNLDMSHMEVLFNTHQGLYCLNAGDGFIQSDSQFDSNGLSGIELNGCGSYRAVNIDISGNGSLGSDKSTGCSLYIHGSAHNHVSATNTFVQLQQGNNAFEDICDIGWDAENKGRDSYSNSFVGLQELGKGAASHPSIYVSDGSNDFFSGTIGITTSSYGIQFDESSIGRALPSTVRLAFTGGTTPATAWNDTTRYGDDFTGSVIGSTATYYIGPNGEISCSLKGSTNPCMLIVQGANNPSNPIFNDFDVFNMVAPTLQTGGYSLGFQIGKAADTVHQAALLRFVYTGNGSSSNATCLGLYNDPSICVTGSGIATLGNNNVPVQSNGTQTAGKLACIKAVGPPPVIGTCTAVSGASCTSCN